MYSAAHLNVHGSQGTVHDSEKNEIEKKKYENVINRNYQISTGIYVEGKIKGYHIFTIDTGASGTILSKPVFEKMEKKPKLHKSTEILNVYRREIQVLVEAKFRLKVGDFLTDLHIIIHVAEINDENNTTTPV